MAFALESEVNPAYCPSVSLYKWRSARTGLQVVLIKRASPSVQGYFAVASEANDNSGCPHTLEHIVFMGSKKYPYKGMLDLLGAKQMSSTNAWTGQDQTCYTLVSAGYEGFLTLLPVYIDHILHATVDKSSCITEVYHIDGDGEEKGVVFSEMQGHEHSSMSLINEEIQRLLYAPDSGYATNTGGNLTALRSLEPATIAQYHQDVYRPSNLSVIVSGDIEPEILLEKMEEIDANLSGLDDTSSVNGSPVHSRPFLDSEKTRQPSPLTENKISEIKFPDSLETSGEINVSWLGPDVSDTVANTALEVVLTYLTLDTVGKLHQAFINVNKEDALAAEVAFFINPFLRTQPELSFYGVPTEKLSTAGEKLLNYLEKTLLDDFDIDLMRQCVENSYDSFINSAENDWYTLIELALSDFLYGDQKKTFEEWLGSMSEFDTLRSWSVQDWSNFITKFIVKPPKACVLGKPSRDEHLRIEEEKKTILDTIKRTQNLEEKAKEVKWAIEKHEHPIPDEVMAQFPNPEVSKIRFILTKSAATRVLEENLPGAQMKLDPSTQALLGPGAQSSDLALNFESIPSQFVTITLYFSPEHVDKRLYPLIDVTLSNLFSLPMKLDDGRSLTADEVAQEVKRDLLSARIGADWSVQEMISLNVVAKASNYKLAIEWIQRAMFNVLYDPERIAIFVARHLKIVAEAKRSETSLLRSTIDETILTDESVSRQTNIIISEPLVKQLENDIEKTASDTKTLADQLFRNSHIRGVVIGDIPRLANTFGGDVLAPWESLTSRLADKDSGKKLPISRILTRKDFLSLKGQRPGNDAHLVLCAATDSCHVKSVSLGPNRYGHQDLPALTLANAYLEMAEGPYWTAVRGPGFAYGAHNSTSVQTGHVSCEIHSAADPMAALKACSTVVRDIVSGTTTVTEQDLQQTVALTVNSLAENVAQPVSAASEKFLDTVIKGYQPDYVYKIIEEIKSVSISDFIRVIEKYYLPLFDTKSSTLFVVSPPGDREKLESALIDAGYNVSVREIEIEDDSEAESDDYDSDTASE